MWSIQQLPRLSFHYFSITIAVLSVVKVYFQNVFFSFFPGHGLKMVVGKILSQLALVEKVTYDILPLRLSRFLVVKEVKSSLKSKEMMLQYHTELAYNHGISK